MDNDNIYQYNNFSNQKNINWCINKKIQTTIGRRLFL